MEISEGKILEALSKIQVVGVVVSERAWMSDPAHYSSRQADFYYPMFTSASVFIPPNPKVAMHQKYFLGIGDSRPGRKGANTSVILGSFNATENAKRNLESVLYLPSAQWALTEQIHSDFYACQGLSVGWKKYLERVRPI